MDDLVKRPADDTAHLLWRLRNNDTAKHLCGLAADRIEALLREREWRPIESAPRSYDPPLSHYNHHAPEILGLWGKSFYCVCRWGGPSQPYWIGGDNKKVPFQPMHWLPLPQPPEAK